MGKEHMAKMVKVKLSGPLAPHSVKNDFVWLCTNKLIVKYEGLSFT